MKYVIHYIMGNILVWLYPLILNWPPCRVSIAEVWIASPASEKIDELWVAFVLNAENGATLLMEKTRTKEQLIL